MSDLTAITPVRRLTKKERVVFDRVLADFSHLKSSDAEQITQYAEASIRYADAAKDTKKNPTVKVPVINRSTGNVTNYKDVRNPQFRTVKEAVSDMNSLARRLMIDAASENKRLVLESKKARAGTGKASMTAWEKAAMASVTEEQITFKMAERECSRESAIDLLTNPYVAGNEHLFHPDYNVVVFGGIEWDIRDPEAPPEARDSGL
jgi:phage terminase small subunit